MSTDRRPGTPDGELRVLYSFPHPLGGPGIGTTAINQVRELARRGVRLTVVCTSVVGSPDLLGAEVVETLTVAGRRIPHRAVGGMDRALSYHDRRVASMLRRGRGRFDVVHGWPLACGATFGVAEERGIARFRESPNCYTAVAYRRVADEVARLGLEIPRGASHRPDAARLGREELEYERSSVVLAPSDPVERSYEERTGPALRVRRHRYGFDPGRFPEPPRPGVDGAPFVLAFVGRCEPRKGLHHALRAWRDSGAAAEGARFRIVGRWEPAYRDLLAGELALPGVEVADFADDVAAILRDADALVLPSVEEGSALVTYEAQASGCALLVSDAAGAVLTDGREGFVHRAGDTAALTGQLGLLVRDVELRTSMRRAALDQRDELTWAAAAAQLERRYRDELASG